jgi:hypothetical protein
MDNSGEALSVDKYQSSTPTVFKKGNATYELKLVLGGDMERYVWFINGKAIHEERTINIHEGDIVRFRFVNQTMMNHPMHLHGHFFRVLTDAGDFSPLKHTVDIPPMGIRTIEFLANEPGEWMLHCHNLYHMKTGMARVVKYDSFTPSTEITEHRHHDPHAHDHRYYAGRAEFATNHAQVDLKAMQTWDSLETHFESREYNGLNRMEVEAFDRHWLSNYSSILLGFTHFEGYNEYKNRGLFGLGYIFPLFFEAQAFVDHRGDLRFDLGKKFQWTKSWYTRADVVVREHEHTEFEVSLMYAKNWNWSAGFMFTEDTQGVGAEYKF